jgi:hypothetical protein
MTLSHLKNRLIPSEHFLRRDKTRPLIVYTMGSFAERESIRRNPSMLYVKQVASALQYAHDRKFITLVDRGLVPRQHAHRLGGP